jgi:hypothetical protein
MKKYKQQDISSGVIKCNTCSEVKSLDNYYSTNGLYNYKCKECHSKKHKQNYVKVIREVKSQELISIVCNTCGIEKLIEDYRKTNKGYYIKKCKQCRCVKSSQPKVVVNEGYKICGKCSLEKPITEFYEVKGKVKSPCKKCCNIRTSIYGKKWSQTEEGKIKLRESRKRYKQKLSDERKIIREEKLRLKNEEMEKVRLEKEERNRLRLEERNIRNELELQKSQELERVKNLEREKVMESYGVTTWEEVQRLRNNETKSKRFKERYEDDSLFKFRKLIQNNVRNSFKRKGFSKTSKCREILGADWEVVKRYFESKFLDGMSWDNQGEWHIDHILPISTAVTEEDVLRLNHYTNLQPLWAEDNIKKSDVLTMESYIKKHFPYCEINVDVSDEVTNTEVKVSDEYKFGWGVF